MPRHCNHPGSACAPSDPKVEPQGFATSLSLQWAPESTQAAATRHSQRANQVMPTQGENTAKKRRVSSRQHDMAEWFMAAQRLFDWYSVPARPAKVKNISSTTLFQCECPCRLV
jgi:hypothetical protein